MLRWAGREMAPFFDYQGRYYRIMRYGKRQLDGVLDLQLAGPSVDTDVVEFATLRLHRRTGRLGLRRLVTVMRRHLVFVHGRAVRTVVVRLHGRGTRRQCQVQPDSREQTEGPLAPGVTACGAVCLADQTLILTDFPG